MSIQLHAKTYYNDPLNPYGDEHYITIPTFDSGGNVRPSYQGQGWQMLSGLVHDQAGPVGGYLNVRVLLGNCEHVGMHDAQLSLSTSISYWGGHPSGAITSVAWSATLAGTTILLTRVTE